MEAKELLQNRNGELVPVRWYCGNCGTIHGTIEVAEECCKPYICTKCGKEISRDRKKSCLEAYYINPLRCSSCYHKDQEDAMEVITEDEYNGEPLEYCENFYEDLDDFIEQNYGDYEKVEDVPDYVRVCKTCKVDGVNIDEVLENIEENIGLECDYVDIFNDIDELREFVKKWNEKQNYTYWQTINKRLKLSEKTKKEIIEG